MNTVYMEPQGTRPVKMWRPNTCNLGKGLNTILTANDFQFFPSKRFNETGEENFTISCASRRDLS